MNAFGRRRGQGAGPKADVWSAACTLYEMLTGDYLFYDQDWIRFFLRITTPCNSDELAAQSFTFEGMKNFNTLKRGIRLIPEKRAMLGNC